MTCKNTFLTKSEFQQLLYISVSGLPGTEIVNYSQKMIMPKPAVMRPTELWTGKQVISSLLKHMCSLNNPPLPLLHLDGKTRTPPTALGAEHNEHILIFRHGELLSGVIDKNSIGSSQLGIIHAVYELYGADLAGLILNAFGRVFTYFLQDAGHTCGIEDLTLTAAADAHRRELLQKVIADTEDGLVGFLDGCVSSTLSTSKEFKNLTKQQILERQTAQLLSSDTKEGKVRLDGAMQGFINKSASDVIKVIINTFF